jgi:hypothetical protein
MAASPSKQNGRLLYRLLLVDEGQTSIESISYIEPVSTKSKLFICPPINRLPLSFGHQLWGLILDDIPKLPKCNKNL